jgi:hypothetical protein
MASFADQIQTFTPYQPEANVQALVSVGTQLQDRFNQGVQRIQGEIDSVAGLPIAKQDVKNYLNQKLGQTKTAVSSSIAQDFSDQRLQNQIGSSIRHMGTDPIIQNGVQSTLRYQKALSDVEQSKKDGKYSIENEYDVMSKANSWLNDGDLNSSFTGQYTPYIDLNKKWMDIVKSLSPDGRVEDIPFVTYQKPDGSIGIDYNKISSVMVERGIEGVSKERLENAIRATLTPDDLNQLGISGRYQFRNYDVNTLLEKSNHDFQSRVQYTNNQLQQLQKDLNLSKSDVKKANSLRSQIEYLNSMLGENGEKGQLQIQHDNELDYIRHNPEDAKAELYKNGFIQEFSNAFSHQKITTKYTDNPFEKVREWNASYALSKSQFGLAQQKFAHDVDQDKFANDMRLKEYNLKLLELKGVASPFTTDFGASTDIPTAMESLTNDIATKSQQSQQIVKDVAFSLGYTPAEMENMVAKYEKGNGNEIPVQARSTIERAIKLRNDAAAMQGAIEKVTQQVKNLPEMQAAAHAIANEVSARAPLNVTRGGIKYTFSPEELLNYVNKETATAAPAVGGRLGSVPTTSATSIDISRLSPKERILHDILQNSRYGTQGFSKSEAQLASILDTYAPLKYAQSSNLGMINREVETRLLPRAGNWMPKIANLDTPKPEARNHLENLATSIVNRKVYEKETNEGLDLDEALKWMNSKDKSDLQFKVFQQGGTTQLWVQKGEDIQKMNITPKEAAQLPSADQYLQSGADLDMATRLMLGGGNTNPTGNLYNSYRKKNDFKNVKDLNVTADFQQDYDTPGKIYINLNLKTPMGWKNIQLDDTPMDVNTAEGYIQRAPDTEILHRFQEAYRRAGDTEMLSVINSMLGEK